MLISQIGYDSSHQGCIQKKNNNKNCLISRKQYYESYTVKR